MDEYGNDIGDAVVEARKLKLEERRNELYKQGFRFSDWAVWERRFLYRSKDESEHVRLERMQHYKETVEKIDEPIEFSDEDYNDPLFANIYGNPLPLAILDHINIFNDITTKNNGEYRKQHWHMKELKIEFEEEEDEEEEEEEEDSTAEQRLSVIDVDNLTLRFHPKLWDIFLYGVFTKTLANTLQICSLKLTSPDDSDYPLEVYGYLKLCNQDGFWHQVIFSRDSDHCQTLTKEDPYLSLTGPYWHTVAPPNTEVYIQADLKLKGTTESNADKFLCLSTKCQEKDLVCNENLSEYDLDFDPDDPYMRHVSSCCEEKPCECREFGKHYLLEMTRTIVTNSVFASICVQLVGMEPPDRLLSCFFTAYLDEYSCEDMKVVLLDCRDGKEVPVLDKEGNLELSRQTICVDWRGLLMVYIELGKTGKELIFQPQLEGEDTKDVDIGSSTMKVKVEWSIYGEKRDRFLY